MFFIALWICSKQAKRLIISGVFVNTYYLLVIAYTI